jgi:antitoxin component of MazEF toxin-antitoxin module
MRPGGDPFEVAVASTLARNFPMDAMLRKMGEDLALVLDRQVWGASGMDGETQVEVVSDATGIQIRPKREIDREEILASAKKMAQFHDETFRKLAQ